MSYKAPNPYVESVVYKGNSSASDSNSIMGMIGITPTGDTTKAILVTSWTEFVEKFALGVATPFMTNSMLAYAVYGFYQNGGTQLYIKRVVGTNAKKATAGADLIFTAKTEGEWGNKISVAVVENADDTENPFIINVYYDGAENLVESFVVNANIASANYFVDIVENNSAYISVSGTLAETASTTLSNGADDLTSINDDTYIEALTAFDMVHNLAGISVPGQATNKIITEVLKYTGNKPVLPVFEIPSSSIEATQIISFVKKACAGKNAVIYGPNVRVIDPLSVTGKTKDVPPSGHIMGVIARTIDTKGEWNAAAGTDAVLKGVVGVTLNFTDEERGKLNEAGINVLLTKPNYGTVIWGARSQSADKGLKYVSNLTLNHTLRRNINDAMQRFEFKNNNASLWVDITAEITGLLETKRLAGAFAGDTAETCYYVRCDSSNNTQATIDKGQVIVEVGYADNKPAEFIIVRVAHQISN